MVGVAVNVQLDPAQAGFVPAVNAILTEGTRAFPMVMVMTLEVTLYTVPHAELTVKTHDT